jgi:hypothetical protein
LPVLVGIKDWDPVVGSDPDHVPEAEHAVASTVSHEIVADWPSVMVAGLRRIEEKYGGLSPEV